MPPATPSLALEHLGRAADCAEQIGHTWAWVSTQWVRAKVLIDGGDGAGALRVLDVVLDVTTRESDHTSTLAGLLTAAGAATAAGAPRAAAVLLGATAPLGRSIAYDPLHMDPVDGRRYVEATSAALPAEELEEALAEGARTDLDAARTLVRALAGSLQGSDA